MLNYSAYLTASKDRLCVKCPFFSRGENDDNPLNSPHRDLQLSERIEDALGPGSSFPSFEAQEFLRVWVRMNSVVILYIYICHHGNGSSYYVMYIYIYT